MIPTSELVDSLVSDMKPVRRLRPPIVRASCWLLIAMLMLGMAALGHGVRPDLMEKLRQLTFAIGIAAAMVTGVLAAMASFIVSLPDRSRKWLLLPVPPLAIWISTIGYGCLTNWISIGPDGVSLGESARCFATLVLVSTPLSLLLLLMLRYAAYFSPEPVAMTASLAVAAMTAIALSILHPLDATIMVLMANIGILGLLLIVSGVWGRRLFEWIGSK